MSEKQADRVRSIAEVSESIPGHVSEQLLSMLRDPGFIEDPYPFYHYLMDNAPVWPTPDGDILFARYEPCRYARRFEIRDFGGRSSRNDLRKEWVQYNSLIGCDPPEHTRLRAILNDAAFTAPAVAAMQEKLDRFTHDLLDDLAPRGEMDLMAEFAKPLPTYVITELLGIPYESKDEWEPWADRIHYATGQPLFLAEQKREAGKYFADAVNAGKEEAAWFASVIKERRRKGYRAQDVITALCDAEERDELTEEQVLGTLVLVIGGGHHTTVNLIGNGMLALFRNPDQMRLLRDDPTLLDNAIEEMLRFDPPLQAGGGGTTERDIVLDSVLVEEGTQVSTIIGSANRDPLMFERPRSFDIRRENAKRHLSFGYGTHFCLGSFLARAEGVTAFKALLGRLKNLRLVDEFPPHEDMYNLRGLASMRVAWDT